MLRNGEVVSQPLNACMKIRYAFWTEKVFLAYNLTVVLPILGLKKKKRFKNKN